MIQSFFTYCKRFLSNPGFYHYSRQLLLLGMPLRTWARYGNYYNTKERIADLGCGPADILRFLDKRQLPEFYVGIDISDEYLDSARNRALRIGLNAQFIKVDLNSIATSDAVRAQLIEILNQYHITTVNMYGVMHHLKDKDILSSINLISQCETVLVINTQDVLIIDGNVINNFYVSLDRGDYVRSEAGYDDLVAKSTWPEVKKKWSSAGLSKVKYIHYRLSK